MVGLPPITPVTPISFQSATDIKEIISTTDATIQGILLGVILALGAAFIYIYREKNKQQLDYQKEIRDLHTQYQKEIRELQGDFVSEIKLMNEKLIDMNSTYHATVTMIKKMIE